MVTVRTRGEHAISVCPFRQVPCRHPDCKMLIRHIDIAKHERQGEAAVEEDEERASGGRRGAREREGAARARAGLTCAVGRRCSSPCVPSVVRERSQREEAEDRGGGGRRRTSEREDDAFTQVR